MHHLLVCFAKLFYISLLILSNHTVYQLKAWSVTSLFSLRHILFKTKGLGGLNSDRTLSSIVCKGKGQGDFKFWFKLKLLLQLYDYYPADHRKWPHSYELSLCSQVPSPPVSEPSVLAAAALLEHPEVYGPSRSDGCSLTCRQIMPGTMLNLVDVKKQAGVINGLKIRVMNKVCVVAAALNPNLSPNPHPPSPPPIPAPSRTTLKYFSCNNVTKN